MSQYCSREPNKASLCEFVCINIGIGNGKKGTTVFIPEHKKVLHLNKCSIDRTVVILNIHKVSVKF